VGACDYIKTTTDDYDPTRLLCVVVVQFRRSAVVLTCAGTAGRPSFISNGPVFICLSSATAATAASNRDGSIRIVFIGDISAIPKLSV